MPVVSDTIGIKVTSSGDTSGIDKTSGSLKQLGRDTDQASSSVSTFGATFKAILASQVVTQMVTGLRDMATTAITSAGSYEQSRIAFETMLGSADKARKLMGEIAEFAKSTPFELPEVVAGTKQLLAFGFAQEQLLPTMRRLGDIASGLGVPVGQLTNVFGQVKVAGRLMGGELLQFTNAGVPMIETLAKVMNKPQNEIKKLVEDGKVGFSDVEKAINSLTNEGGKFGGMMEKQSQTFNGVVSNIKDGFGQMLRAAVGVTPAGDIVAGGVFDKIKNAAQAAMPAVQRAALNAGPAVDKLVGSIGDLVGPMVKTAGVVAEYLGPSFKALFNTIGQDLLPALRSLWDAVGPLVGLVGVAFVGALRMAVDVINVVVSALSPLINWLGQNKEVVWGVVGAWVALKAAMMIGATIQAVTMAINALTLGMGAQTVATIGMRNALMSLALPGGAFALVAGAAVGAGVLIINKWKETTDTINKTKNAIADAGVSADIVNGKLLNLLKTGDKAQQIRSYDTLTKMGQGAAANRALGISGSYASGGYTGPGGENQVAGVVHKGEYVVPKSQVDQSTGRPKAGTAGGGSQITVSYNAPIYLTTPEATREFFDIQDRNALLASRGLSLARG